MSKTILFLGAAPTQIPPIRYALGQGYRVVTCDYLPDNPGHKLSHESYNVSTTDKEAVLRLAQRLKIDAIVAYASDPSAPTAAYVAEKMNLPGNPFCSVLTLARKDMFRAFLKEHGFNVPPSQSFYDPEQAKKWLREIGFPAFIKPVDSSGSKGVTLLTEANEFDSAFSHALSYSREKKVVVESKIISSGYQVAGDGFIVDGMLVFRCWADEHFDKLCNGLVPIGQTFPTSQPDELLKIAHSESQRLLSLLGMMTGALNFDFLFAESGEFYFLELGPRNGGCLIPEVINYATGVDLIKCTIDAALGLPCENLVMKPADGFWSSYMIHSLETGFFEELLLSDWIKSKIVEINTFVEKKQKINKYIGANDTIGTMILSFDTINEMVYTIDNMENHVNVIVSN